MAAPNVDSLFLGSHIMSLNSIHDVFVRKSQFSGSW
jgi:hypothetical protein